MTPVKAFSAILKGFQLCLFEADIRRLAMWPWLIGAVCYVVSIFAAIKLHGTLLAMLVSDPSGFLSTLLYWLAWIVVTLVLLILSMVLTLVAVMVLTGAFQSSIAMKVLSQLGADVPQEAEGVKAAVGEASRTVVVETAKLLWLLPFMALALVLGIIPLLAPVGVLIGAWLLAFQFVDVVLDIYKIGVRKRLGFSLKNALVLIAFGLGLTVCWAIPFLGLLLPPPATAGAAWLLKETKLLEEATSS